ncbi:MAG: DUF5692 family protein [Candidatus Dependentiae bacterium]|nr:DUF5692 family protein [Candidatus Dependentiae bacterium]
MPAILITTGFYVAFLIFLLICNELLHRSKILAWSVLVALPIILSPYWIFFSNESQTPFEWAKLYTLFFTCCCVLAYRYTSFEKTKWISFFVYGLLIINIFEAAFTDFTIHHIFNPLAGILLIITIPSHHHIDVDNKSPYKDLIYTIPFGWIIGYTLWNLTFVYNNFPDFTALHMAILGAPLIVDVFRRGHWFQTRLFTLTIRLLLDFTGPDIPQSLLTKNWFNHTAAIVLGLCSLLWMIGLTLYNWHTTRTLTGIPDNKPNLVQ